MEEKIIKLLDEANKEYDNVLNLLDDEKKHVKYWEEKLVFIRGAKSVLKELLDENKSKEIR